MILVCMSSLDHASKFFGIASSILTSLGVLGGFVAAMILHRLFLPHIRVKVKIRRLKGGAVAEMEVENVSRVALKRPIILFDAKRHPAGKRIQDRFVFPKADAPNKALASIRVLNSTTVIRPGEVISIEKWIDASPADFIHAGLQLRYQFPNWYLFPLRLLLCVREVSWSLTFARRRRYLRRFVNRRTSWTSTAIAGPDQATLPS